VELSPQTARELGIKPGADVRITSSSGASITAPAVVIEGMATDVAAVAYVPAAPRGGRWARLIIADARAVLGGDASPGGSSVRVTPA
jgi:anaerobic selenocysteine-containing dehydrogenase